MKVFFPLLSTLMLDVMIAGFVSVCVCVCVCMFGFVSLLQASLVFSSENKPCLVHVVALVRYHSMFVLQ